MIPYWRRYVCIAWMVVFLGASRCVYGGGVETGPSEEAIVQALPAGAKLADDIPVHQFARPPQDGRRANHYLADVDGDGQAEIVAAYYNKSWEHAPANATAEEIQVLNEQRWEQATVAVLEWDGRVCTVAWCSNGWGAGFRAGLPQDLSAVQYEEISRHYFLVEDVSGDGIPEIIFTRSGYNAMGTLFEVWRHGPAGYARVLCLAQVGRIGRRPAGIAIFEECDEKNRPLDAVRVWAWEDSAGQFVRKE